MHSNEIQFEYSAFVRHTLGRLNFTAEASDFLSVGSDNNKSSDYCLRLNVSTHEPDSDSPKKVKKKWALINKREEHQVKSFVFYRYERVKNVRLFHFLRLHIRPFVQRSSPSSKNSSIAFNLLIYSIKCQVRLRWSQNSSSPLSLSDWFAGGSREASTSASTALIRWDMRSDEGEKMMPKKKNNSEN